MVWLISLGMLLGGGVLAGIGAVGGRLCASRSASQYLPYGQWAACVCVLWGLLLVAGGTLLTLVASGWDLVKVILWQNL